MPTKAGGFVIPRPTTSATFAATSCPPLRHGTGTTTIPVTTRNTDQAVLATLTDQAPARHTGGIMQVDLSVLSPAMLDGIYSRLLAEFAAAKDACDVEEARLVHLQLEDVIAEYLARTEAWIMARQ